jgi:ubiquinone/menaquinone biosynthesis C-methylase UbiE
MGEPPEHAFTAVDEQDDPSSWIDVLDRVRQEPAYAAYKRRVAELLLPSSGGTYLEVGCGTGQDALALASRFGVEVAGVDLSRAMVDEARRRGLSEAQVASADALPFDGASFAGCWADRVLQHLERPDAAVGEMARVTRPGGRVVVADPDYDTQVVAVADRELARRVLRFRADHLLRNGTIAHRAGVLFADAGLADVVVEAAPVVLRDPAALDNAMGLRTWAATAAERGLLPAGDAEAWERAIDDAVERDRFLYAFTVFLTAGTAP